jgi:thiosulfate/3-mercaptopyruvate sulfurtransferase
MRILRDDVLWMLDEPRTLLLDGRAVEEYKGLRVGAPGGPDVGAMRYGRIPGARHLHFEDVLRPDKSFKSTDEVRSIASARGVDTNKDIVVYCRLSHRATVLYFALTELLGLNGVRVYDGSWTE